MKQPKEDIYITMLRYGRDMLESRTSFRDYDLTEYLNKNGYSNITVNHGILQQYFQEIFFPADKDTKYNPGSSDFYYLKPEKYMALLEYDNMLETRKEAKKALWVAIIAIILTLFFSILEIIKCC